MPTREETPTNPKILKWAREQALFTPEEAASRARIKDAKRRGLSAEDRLVRWESDTAEEGPTLGELELIAKAYRRPLLTFFLSDIPRVETTLRDFRTVGDHPITGGSPEFAAFRRQIEALQREVRTILLEQKSPPVRFLGTVNLAMTPAEVAQTIRSGVAFPFKEQQRVSDSEMLFSVLRGKADEAGIFVIRKADLGSFHSKISVSEFRGLVICDSIAPFIVVNPNDAKAALLFTLIHEITHLFLGESGVSNINAFSTADEKQQDREVFCNRVAAEFLVPEAVLLDELAKTRNLELEERIDTLSRVFKVSRVVVARRLLDLGKLGRQAYWELYDRWRDEMDNLRDLEKESEGGPRYFTNTKSKLGSKLLNTLIGAAYDGKISYADASRLLGIKVDYFRRFYQGQDVPP